MKKKVINFALDLIVNYITTSPVVVILFFAGMTIWESIANGTFGTGAPDATRVVEYIRSAPGQQLFLAIVLILIPITLVKTVIDFDWKGKGLRRAS